jgi:membrane-associated HD superfamily phosphohydrolase
MGSQIISCDKTIIIFYLLIFLLGFVTSSMVINSGKSDKKISWVLYVFAIMFGIGVILVSFLVNCDSPVKKQFKKAMIIVFTIVTVISNMIAMFMSRPSMSGKDLFIPHILNIILLFSGVFMGLSLCGEPTEAECSRFITTYQ